MKLGLFKSKLMGTPVIISGVVLASIPAQAAVLSGVTGPGTVFIDAANITYYDNAIDFQEFGSPIPAADNPDWGNLGEFNVTNATGSLFSIFAPTVGAPNPDGQALDVILPGTDIIPNFTYSSANLPAGTFLPDGTIVSNFLRFDIDNDGSIGAGDVTFSYRTFTENPGFVGNQQTIQVAFEGYFQEIDSVANYGTKNEIINLTGPRLEADAVLSAGVLVNPNDLPSISCNLANPPIPPGMIDNLDPTSECAQVFNGIIPDPVTGVTYTAADRGQSSADGPLSVDARVPEPGNVAAVLALGSIFTFGMKKRKNLV